MLACSQCLMMRLYICISADAHALHMVLLQGRCNKKAIAFCSQADDPAACDVFPATYECRVGQQQLQQQQQQ